jgi:hypothetical protein
MGRQGLIIGEILLIEQNNIRFSRARLIVV